jgi:hypothetical protein
VGVLNIIYGIGALDDANYFVNQTRFILTNLNTLGWVSIILGVIQLTAGFSLISGNTYGRVIGIVAGASARSRRSCRSAARTRGGRSPSSPVRLVVHGIFVYGDEEPVART